MRRGLVRFWRTSIFGIFFFGFSQALEAADINATYVRSLAAAGKTVLVIEYYDGAKTVVGRRGFVSKLGFQAVSPTTVEIGAKKVLQLYGIEPCSGEMTNAQEGYAGACADFAKQQLQILLKAARVIFCQAFVSEQFAASQDVTCFAYFHYPGSLDTVDNLETQLLSIGALRLSRRPDGSVLRPDLTEAERIGRQGFGMWGDPQVMPQ